MRALVVVNHQATTMSQWVRDVLLAALRHDLKVEVAETNHRGHAVELGRRARSDGIELVLGDMTTARVDRAFNLVYLVFNTIMNLTTQQD